MLKSLSACLLAGSVALASTTAPAVAGNDNFKKFVLGATTLFIIGSALSNNNRSHGGSTYTTRRATPQPTYRAQTNHGCYRHRHTSNGHAHYHGNC